MANNWIEKLTAETAARYDARQPLREERLQQFRRTRDLRAVDSPKRLAARARRLRVPEVMLESVLHPPAQVETVLPEGADRIGFERVIGCSDFLPVSFLEQGIAVARAIGRIVIRGADGRLAGYGTGFLVSPRLVLTNHHVLENQDDAARSAVEFEY